MNYTKIYNNIIEHARTRELDGYKEKHHILPSSLGGTNDTTNLVTLSAREHFICHYLLTKMYDKSTVEYYKMLNAFIMMKCSNTIQSRYFNSHLYETKKVEYSKMVSMKQTGVGNSQYGSLWIYNLDLKKSKKIQKNEIDTWLSKGWLLGRKLNFNNPSSTITRSIIPRRKKLVNIEEMKIREERKRLNKEKRKAETLRKNELKKLKKAEDAKRKKEDKKKQNIEKYTELYKIYDAVGFKKFVELTNYEYSLESLVYQFQIYVESFIPQSRKKRGK